MTIRDREAKKQREEEARVRLRAPISREAQRDPYAARPATSASG
jgi:hypothetical protein